MPVPDALPVTIPVEPTLTLPLLLQVPPPASLKLVVNPWHIVVLPNIGVGNGLMVTTAYIGVVDGTK